MNGMKIGAIMVGDGEEKKGRRIELSALGCIYGMQFNFVQA